MKNFYLAVIVLFLSGCSLVPKDNLDTLTAVTPTEQGADWAKTWWLKRHQEKLLEKEHMNSVDLVFLGDSITHNWERKPAAKKAWDEYYLARNPLNLGFSGDKTEHVLWRIKHGAVDNITPKLLVLMIGTNNTGRANETSTETAIGIKAIIDELTLKLPETKILLLAIFPRGKKPTDIKRQRNDRSNNIIKTYANDKSVFYLDINHIFLDENKILQPSVMDDYLHPNADQYRYWAQAIEPSIVQLMAE